MNSTANPSALHPQTNTVFYGARDRAASHAMMVWLFVICTLIALMVTIGGATRLTESGLSITEWNVILGALPPLGEVAWQIEFEKYKQIPEYTEINQGMSLAEFKVIYWWEWGHRNLGRFIGLAFLIPFLGFWVRGMIVTQRLKMQLGGLFFLICVQGALGWYMVSSGLSERVDVSQYRLAAHLGLAMILFSACLWTALRFRAAVHGARGGEHSPTLLRWALILLALVFCQIILGALVAGMRAGQVYTTWPLMDGAFFPAAYFNVPGRARDIFESIAAVQFNHRMMAYILMVTSCAFYLYARRLPAAQRPLWRRQAGILSGVIIVQAGLGICTLLMATPIALALIHQLGALLVLSVAVINVYLTRD